MQTNEGSPLPEYIRKELEASERKSEFLSSLPTSSLSTYLYDYQGCWLTASQLQGVLPFQKNFEAKDSDVFVATSPKSGTTWLKALVYATTTRRRYAVRHTDHPLLVKNPHELIPSVDIHIYGKNEKPDLSGFKSPRLFSTHLPYPSLPPSIKDSACKVVYICRNPKDTFVSYWHHVLKWTLPLGMTFVMDEEFERFCKGVTGFGPYWDHVLSYWRKSLETPEKLLFLKYEDLKEQPSMYLKQLADFLGCPFSIEEEASRVPDEIIRLCSFDNLSNLEVNRNGKLPNGHENNIFFRRGEVGDWKNHLTDEMIKRLDSLAEEKFKPYGLQL